MKKFILTAVLAFALVTTTRAGWWRTYGGAGWEEGRCVQITSDSNYIICGTKDDSLWLLKVDTSGNVIWDQTHWGGKGTWIEETSDGYIVAGGFTSLFKTDSQGEIQWSSDFGDFTTCVQQTSDGGYILVENEDVIFLKLVKTDSQGDSIWVRTFGDGSNNHYRGEFVRETSDGGYIVTGLYATEDGEWFSQGVLLLKTDSLGNTIWNKTYGGVEYNEYSKGYCVRETSDGGFIVTGHHFGSLWLLKTDTHGDTLWTQTYSIPSGGMGYSVQETADGGYIVVGINDVFISSSQLEITGGVDLWLLKTDSQGDTLWTRMYGGEDGDVGLCVQQTDDSGYIVSGYTLSYGAGSWDVYFLKTDSLGLLCIEEDPGFEKQHNWEMIQAIGQRMVLRYEDRPEGIHATVFDATGRKIDELQSHEVSGTLLWGDNEPAGVYFIQALDNQNQLKTVRVVLVR